MALHEFLKQHASSSSSSLLLLIIVTLLILTILPYFWTSYKRRRSADPIPTCWPILRMLPSLLHNSHRLHEFATDILIHSGGTFTLKGPWFANSDLLVTSDPTNIHHILSKNFSNYPKGPHFRKIFDVLGDGIFNADSDIWETHRKTTMSFLNHPLFKDLLMKTTWEKTETGLIPVMDSFLTGGKTVDLQDIFQRFSFDTISILTLGHDPKALSIGLPDVPTEKAINIIEEAILFRHILPERLWRLQKWLGFGMERKLTESWVIIDDFLYSCIIGYNNKHEHEHKHEFSALNLYSKVYNEEYSSIGKNSLDVFLRDTFFNLMIAGRDTTSAALSWFFWLLARNPDKLKKIREEIESKSIEELVYLHGALCETLRLFPSVAFEHKSPVRHDMLPSGEKVKPNSTIIMSFYSTGRMESIWGKDVLEFKPERWISDRDTKNTKNRILHVPSFKFPAFNAGPRTCLGKEMAFTQMKIVASAILLRYDIQVVDEHLVMPDSSIILHMKYGLNVKIIPRDLKCHIDQTNNN